LAGEGINIRVVDLYSVKPVDFETLQASAAATGGRVIVVEDHWGEGGLGSAVLECFATHTASREDGGTDFRMTHLHPTELAGSATPAQQLAVAGIDAAHIAEAVRVMVG
jgi:transketolase